MSHEIGRLGILERENAALLNASLGELATKVVSNMEAALAERGLRCPFYVSQNDGTLMSAQFIARYPALTRGHQQSRGRGSLRHARCAGRRYRRHHAGRRRAGEWISKRE